MAERIIRAADAFVTRDPERSGRIVQTLLKAARTGIIINGDNPQDPKIHDPLVYSQLLRGSVGLGDSYVAGAWDCKELNTFFYRMLSAEGPLVKTLRAASHFSPRRLKARFINEQEGEKGKEIGEAHYNRFDPVIQEMLGDTMAYTCGYWEGLERTPENLDRAQEAKFDLLYRKLGLTSGMKLLDIGCGYGSFAKYAAERGVTVVGITVSDKQVEQGREFCRGLPVELRTQDYHDIPKDKKFDAIVSVGMAEHVGPANFPTYLQIARDHLVDGGKFVLHTITKEHPGPTNKWIAKEIFPNSQLPTPSQIKRDAERVGFHVWDDHAFGRDYDPTLMAWWEKSARYFDQLPDTEALRRDRRTWEYYLKSCAGAFRAGAMDLNQFVLSMDSRPADYEVIR